MRELKTSHVECGYCDERLTDTPEAFATHDAACERNPLARRVAELEEQNATLQLAVDAARLLLESKQRQLAWTPVAQGLPTEPGRYQFIDDINFRHPDHGEFPHYWRKPKESPTENLHWFLHHGRWFGSPLDWCKGYTYWRKVELPVRPIQAELAATKADWEDRWSRRWEP